MSGQKINGCLPSNWTRLSCTRINHASIFWSMGRTWFNSRKTKLCGHGEGNTRAVVKKKKVLCTPNLPDHPLSRHQIVQESGYFSNWKRHYLKGHTWGPGWFRWQLRSASHEKLSPPSDPSWDLTVCSLSPALLQTHSHVHTQKQAYTQTHTPDRHRLNALQVRAGPEPVLMQSFLGILSSPLFFLFFFFFLHLIALFTFPGWLKAFPQRWLMFWTGRELDYETLWPAQRKG